MTEENDTLWIFGYGSLMWRPCFPFEDSFDAYITGFVRRFWQKSFDHRGTVFRPGRVVTLHPDDEQTVVWGRVFKVERSRETEILEQLDYREKGGYQRLEKAVAIPCQKQEVQGLVYFADHTNPNFAGRHEDAEAIAKVAYHAFGPSGSNREYVLNLAAALRSMGQQDEHVFSVEEALLELIKLGP